jgi:prepilin-type N-terminal cleavage/methylation domain-containing protein
MKKAFTLIELLVVVAIIGILATVVVVNLSSSQGKARDSKVKTDLSTIANAAELTKLDTGAFYSSTVSGVKALSYASTAVDIIKTTTYAAGATPNGCTGLASDTTLSYQNFKDSDGKQLIGGAPTNPVSANAYSWMIKSAATPNCTDTGNYIVFSKQPSADTNYFVCKTGKACDFGTNALPTQTTSF